MTTTTTVDPALLITQVPDLTIAPVYLPIFHAPVDDDDMYCIFNMRGIRRDLRRRDAKLIPNPLAIHLKMPHNAHIPWEQLPHWPWYRGDQAFGEGEWRNRAIPVVDVPPVFGEGVDGSWMRGPWIGFWRRLDVFWRRGTGVLPPPRVWPQRTRLRSPRIPGFPLSGKI
jgi:hypothetical protein